MSITTVNINGLNTVKGNLRKKIAPDALGKVRI
jgi:hypothetical protein